MATSKSSPISLGKCLHDFALSVWVAVLQAFGFSDDAMAQLILTDLTVLTIAVHVAMSGQIIVTTGCKDIWDRPFLTLAVPDMRGDGFWLALVNRA